MHIYLRVYFPDCKTPVSPFWIDTWVGDDLKSKTETKRALSQGRTGIRNLLLFAFSFHKQVCPKQMLHHRSSSLETQTCVLSVQEHPGTTGQNLRFQTSRHLAQALSSAAFQLLLLEPHLKPSPSVSINQHHRVQLCQISALRNKAGQTREFDIKAFHWSSGNEPNSSESFQDNLSWA